MERVDQPLAVDPPILREIRSAINKARENGRQGKDVYQGLALLEDADVPSFYSGCFGMGSRDLQAEDMIAAVDNMLEDGDKKRQFYLGIDFLRPDGANKHINTWSHEIAKEYPHLKDLTLKSKEKVSLAPKGSISMRMHSVGGWGAITMGKNLTMTLFELLGMQVKSNPKYGSEKKGQPTTFYSTFAHEPIRMNCELKSVNIVLSPDPNVFLHSDPLMGLVEGGVFIIQTEDDPVDFWYNLSETARNTIRKRKIKLYCIDAFAIARAEASDVELQYRMQGNAFPGCFFPCISFDGSGKPQ